MLNRWFMLNRWLIYQIRSDQSLSCVRLFATPWIAARQASLSITNPRSSLRLTSIKSVMPSSHLILCHPLLLLPPIPPSIRVFSSESALPMRWPKYWSFSFSISPSKEIPGLISFRMDWLDLLAVQGTLKSLLQHHSSKASILQRSAFFIVQLSHPYMTTGKTIALTRRTFVGKVMSLLLNMLSRLVITFLPRSKRLLISWLQSPSVVILEPRKIKSDTVRHSRLLGFPSGSAIKNLPAMQETQKTGVHPHIGKIPWRRKWQPTPVFLPGKSCGWRSLSGYSPWGWKELVSKWTHSGRVRTSDLWAFQSFYPDLV